MLERGLKQVARCAQRLGREVGYLVFFQPCTEGAPGHVAWEERGRFETRVQDGVQVTVLWA
ncbi:MAG: hypothetical protein ACPGUV_08360 [Polyangiales bacterium]